MSDGPVQIRKVGLFLVLTFGISWTVAVLFAPVGHGLSTLQGTVLAVVGYMWAQAIAALVTQLWSGDPIRTGCGLVRGGFGGVRSLGSHRSASSG
jgi:hypothetical protein